MRSPESNPSAKMLNRPQAIPQVIFLDAVGTLFGVRHSVGFQYAKVAANFGIKLDADAINRAFYQSFQAAPRMAFPDLIKNEIAIAEYQWWLALAKQTFSLSDDLSKFADFEKFFKSLYAYFAEADPWFVYPEAIATLTSWRNRGITLGVLSNFDSRIYAVLTALQLDQYFDSITISTEAGAAKPHRLIFEKALAKHNLLPDLAWHIGDSFTEDYQGASALGIRTFWLNRDRQTSANPEKQKATTIYLLSDLFIPIHKSVTTLL
jgi:putative hydrolase of the HAD superfamily